MTNRQNLLSRFIHASLWAAASSYIFFAVNFFGQIVLARMLRPSDYGIFALMFSVVELIGIFLTISTVSGYIHSKGDQAEFNACFMLNFMAAVVYGFIAMIGYTLIERLYSLEYAQVFLFICVAQIIRLFSKVYLAPLERELQYKRVSLIQGFTAFGALLVAISIAFFHANVWILVFRELLVASLLLLASYFFSPMRCRFAQVDFSIRPQLIFGFKTMIARSMEVIYYRIPDIIVHALLGRVALGNFYHARYAAYMPIKISQPFTHQTLFAFMSRLRDDRREFEDRLFWMSYLLIRLLLPIAFMIYLFGKQLFTLVYGAQWALAGEYFRYFSLFMLISPLFAAYLSTCYSLSLQKYATQAYLLALLVFLTMTMAWPSGLVASLAFSIGLMTATLYLLHCLSDQGIMLPLGRIFALPIIVLFFSGEVFHFTQSSYLAISTFLIGYFVLCLWERELLVRVLKRIFSNRVPVHEK